MKKTVSLELMEERTVTLGKFRGGGSRGTICSGGHRQSKNHWEEFYVLIEGERDEKGVQGERNGLENIRRNISDREKGVDRSEKFPRREEHFKTQNQTLSAKRGTAKP